MSTDFELPSDVKALLDEARGHVTIPAASRARLAKRLSATLHGAQGAKTLAWKGFMAKGALVVAVAGGALALRHASTSEPPLEISTAYVEPAPVIATATVAASAQRAAPTTGAQPPRPPVVTHVAVTKPVDPEVLLEAERKLLDEARDALVRGEPERALDATGKHAARFPRGTLAQERYALRVRALGRLGRSDDARALASEMAARFPHSFLLETIP